MTEQQQPNQAKEARNRLLRALGSQQEMIASQAAEIDALKKSQSVLVNAVQGLVSAAGIQANPRFASLMSIAGTPDEAPATTTEQAAQPMATDDVENVGAAPAPANTEVTPDAVTDVMSTDVALPEDKPLDNLQDPTAPVAGTDAVDPDAVFEGDVKVGNPNNNVQDPPGSSGWTGTPGSTNRSTSAKQVEAQTHDRYVACIRLARLQIAAGLKTGEDLAVAQEIFDSEQPLNEIEAVSNTLASVAVAQQPTRRTEAHRHLVPQPAQRRTPSLQQQPGITPHTASSNDRGEDEWVVGFDSEMNISD